MTKTDLIKQLFYEIYGRRANNLNCTDITLNGFDKFVNDETGKCDKCNSCKAKQDLPYYKNIENVETIIIAESPGNGEQRNEALGSVFGWHVDIYGYPGKVIRSYFNYFREVLKIDLTRVYITDAVKCYTEKGNFNSAFRSCNSYLKREIEIINPKRIILISKQPLLEKFLTLNFKNIEKIRLVHPSNQNISKIPTTAEFFSEVGRLTHNEKWIKLGEEIKEEYDSLKKVLNAKNERTTQQ